MPATLYTAEEFARLPDYPRYELDRGVLVPMTETSAPQGIACSRIHRRMANFVEEQGLGECVCNDTGFQLEWNPDTVRAPDVSFVRAERLPEDWNEGTWFEGGPDLAVEVIWARSTRGEVRKKLPRLFENGCPLAWVFDIKRNHAEVHRPGREPRIVGMDGELDGEDILPGFKLRVGDVLKGLYPPRRRVKGS